MTGVSFRRAWQYGLLLICAGCAGGPLIDIKPGERPALETDEAGLWMALDKAEAKLMTSGKAVEDPALNAYVRGIVCDLAGELCRDIRTYIVRSPGFNASMAPNGMMNIRTGLLLRAENESQLAFILSHELAHYRRRHTLRNWQDLRAKSSGAVVFQLATAIAGVGFIGLLGSLAIIDSHFAFSRDMEREADEAGFQSMVETGYHPPEAARVWQYMLEEKEASTVPAQKVFFATHPPTEERFETLSALVETASSHAEGPRVDRHRALTAPYRMTWLRDELRAGDYGGLDSVIDRLLEAGFNPGTLHYFKGELYRKRATEGDLDRALSEFRLALDAPTKPSETHRSLGLLLWSMARPDEARGSFETYLKKNPGADDGPIVESYIEEIARGTQ